MKKLKVVPIGAAAILLFGLPASDGAQPPAQTAARPQAYSLTRTSSMPQFSEKVYHNGARERIDLTAAPGDTNPQEVHQTLLFNSETHKAYAEDPASHTCFSAQYPSSDDLTNYDPFFIPPGATPAMMLPPGSKMTGVETVNGIVAQVYEGESTDKGITSTTKVWWSETYGIPAKMEVILPDTPPMVMSEIRHLSSNAPQASLFGAPSGCKEAQGQWTPAGFQLSGQKTVTLGAVAPMAQPSPLAAPSSLPTHYTLLAVSTMNDASMVTGRPATLKIYRNGSKERVEVTLPPGGGGSGFYGNYLFDFKTHQVYISARTGNSPQSPWSCEKYPSSEARLGYDPVTDSADIWTTMTKMGTVKKIGEETVNGVPAEVEGVSFLGTMNKIWIAQKEGFIIRYSGPMNRGYEVKHMDFGTPPASLLATPTGCTEVQGEWNRSGF